MPPAGFEPAIPAREWLQIHALDRAAAEIDFVNKYYRISEPLELRRLRS